MECDDLWPVWPHQLGPLFIQMESQLTLSHINPEVKVWAGPGSAFVTVLAFSPCSLCGSKSGGSECNVRWLSDGQESLLCLGLSSCLQRRWREHWGTERPFHLHCAQMLSVWSVDAHNQEVATPNWLLILQVKRKFYLPRQYPSLQWMLCRYARQSFISLAYCLINLLSSVFISSSHSCVSFQCFLALIVPLV